MIPSDRHRLMEAALLPPAFADSLAAVRRAARHRRLRRRAVRGVAAALALVAGAWLYQSLTGGNPDKTSPAGAGANHSLPFVLVTNRDTPQPSAVILRNPAAPACLVVTTRPASGTIPLASRDDVFASAGSRPGGLHRFPDGTSRWMWLDQAELADLR
jgi:hypothetical protein